MSKTNEKSAFPHEAGLNNTGMTLRDYFAAKATNEDINMHSMGSWAQWVEELPSGRKEMKSGFKPRTREEAKYAYADAMLKARAL
jgi:hypothetical protein